MNKLFTIAIPTKNRDEYLVYTIDSILQQNGFQDIELIICDNASTDRTYEFMQNYIGYNNISYYRNSTSLSIDENMLKVASFVQTKYFLWLGDDDFIIPGGLEKILDFIHQEYDFILLSATRMSEDLETNLGCNLETSMKNIYINEDVIYNSPKDFFTKHCFHIPFGTLIVNNDLYKLVLPKAERFMNTSHAYGGVLWDYLALKYSLTNKVHILLVREELIVLRQIKKTWIDKATVIMMVEIPEWFLLQDNLYKKEIDQELKYYMNIQFSVKSLIFRSINGELNFDRFLLLTKYATGIQKFKYLLACMLPTINLSVKNKIKYILKIFKNEEK